MKFYIFASLLATAFCLASSQEDSILPSDIDDINVSTDPTRVFLDALQSSGYEPRLFPEGNDGPGSPVEVLSTMYILDVQKVDDFSMDFSAQFYFRQAWNDSRLKFDGLESEHVLLRNVDKIWTPDLFFVEEKQGQLHKLMGPNIFCRIKSTGEVLFSSRLSMTFKCPMDLRKYPHDVQKCSFRIESYGHDLTRIELGWDYRKFEPVTANDDISLYDFALTDVVPSTKHAAFSFGNYSALQVTFTFERKTGFFVTRLFVPFVILVLLSSLSFWVHAKEKALRLSLLFVILYLMTNIGSDINDRIQPTPYTKGSDVWIAVCQSFVFASFLEFIVVSIIQRQQKTLIESGEKDPEAPEVIGQNSKFFGKTRDTLDSMTAFVAKRLKGYSDSHPVDKICRLLYPIFFILFCILYALIYCI